MWDMLSAYKNGGG